jgi:hypothetical protein
MLAFGGRRFEVVEQNGNATFVDQIHATHFELAEQHGCHGFLFESSPDVLTLKVGDCVTLDDAEYTVTQLVDAEAVEPDNAWSDFRVGDMTVTSTELFERVYAEGKLVLQTCFNGNKDRRFVIAELL